MTPRRAGVRRLAFGCGYGIHIHIHRHVVYCGIWAMGPPAQPSALSEPSLSAQGPASALTTDQLPVIYHMARATATGSAVQQCGTKCAVRSADRPARAVRGRGVWRVACGRDGDGRATRATNPQSGGGSMGYGSLPGFLGCSLDPAPFASAIKWIIKRPHATRLGRPLSSVGS
jgi:hypothetical protein